MTETLFSEEEKKALCIPAKKHHAGADAQISQTIYRALLTHTQTWRDRAPA